MSEAQGRGLLRTSGTCLVKHCPHLWPPLSDGHRLGADALRGF